MDLSALTISWVEMVIGSFQMSLVSLSFLASMLSEMSLLSNLEYLSADSGGWVRGQDFLDVP